MVDDEVAAGALSGGSLEAELFFEGVEEGGAVAHGCGELVDLLRGEVGREEGQVDVVEAGVAGHVRDRALVTLEELAEHPAEAGHGDAGAVHLAEVAEGDGKVVAGGIVAGLQVGDAGMASG